MFSTLACLAVSMTGVAWLLAWIDPSPSTAEGSVPAEMVAARVRTIVDLPGRIDQARWLGVEIVAGDRLTGDAALLSASATVPDAHFVVDAQGEPSPAPFWLEQQAAAQGTATVRIEVACRDANEPMTKAQWAAVRGLVGALNARLCPSGESLPIEVGPTWRRVYGLRPDTVFELSE